jgi:hypothetical protein
MSAARMRAVINAWETVRYELLNTRICDLRLSIPGSPVEPLVRRVQAEVAAKGLRFRPECYLTDSWGCPNEVPILGIPFYLADRRLARIEEEQTGEVEDEQTAMMLLRHEAGHAFNYAYRLWEDREWTETFGRFSAPYRDAFEPDPFSRRFVRHLAHGQYRMATYAQKHPDEDFAETFAVWLTPRCGWRRKYANWPAIAKLRYVDRLLRRVRKRDPVVAGGAALNPVEELRVTLAEHYGARAERYRRAAQGYVDDKLREVFPGPRSRDNALPAGRFLRRRRGVLMRRIARWTGLPSGEILMVLAKLEDRARALELRMRVDREAVCLLDVTALVTAMATRFGLTGALDS